MKESIIDTNVLLRYLTADIPEQAARCRNLFCRVLDGEEIVEIPLLVLAETVWTLTKYYKQPKGDVVESLGIILKTQGVKVRDKKVIIDALDLYKNSNISFTDAYLATFARTNNKAIYSFDRDFDKSGALRQEP